MRQFLFSNQRSAVSDQQGTRRFPFSSQRSAVGHLRPIRRSLYRSVFILLLLVCGCSRRPVLLGHWRTEPPASLSFEVRPDRSIWLTQDGVTYRVFGYKLLDSSTLELYDGMGRMRRYTFQITGDQLRLSDQSTPGAPAEVWYRQR